MWHKVDDDDGPEGRGKGDREKRAGMERGKGRESRKQNGKGQVQ